MVEIIRQKTLTEAQLREQAAEMLTRFPEVLASEDGNILVSNEANKGYLAEYCKSKGLKYYTFKKEAPKKEAPKKTTKKGGSK